MRTSIQTGLLLGGTLLPLALLATGCGSYWGCDATATCPPPPTPSEEGTGNEAGSVGAGGAGGEGGGDAGPTCPTDPAEGEVGEDCGIFVSASTGEDHHPGTRELPVRTLSHAITLAEAGPGRVYACAEIYPEAVTLSGVSLFGGFDCDHDWRYVVDEDRRAEVLAPPALAALTLRESAAMSSVLDVRVIASDAIEPGASSVAVFALPGSKAFFARATLIAGNGADGAHGEDGSHNGQPAQKGSEGNDGSDACTLDPGLGGLAVATQCMDGTSSIGGQGGDANEIAATGGLEGIQAPDPNPQGFGAGGEGESAAQGTACTPGIGGAHGEDGHNGSGAEAYGRLTITGYIGSPGADGLPGFPGQGGGGGGASLGKAICGAAPHGGAGGGSGGSGGCGGRGGKGGQAGGSSIVFALLSDDIRAEDVVLISGKGGHGGNGGALQQGGQGGLPGHGGFGFGPADGAKGGCGGGIGGQGGNGGNGGGGRGGHSVMTAVVGEIVLHVSHWTILPGQNGKGGLGGKGGMNFGQDGESGQTVTLEQ
jgi:hypothetical protein